MKRLTAFTLLLLAPAFAVAQGFDLSQTKLPAGYQGMDPVKVFDALSDLSLDITKSPFETTEAFNLRIAKIKVKPFIDSITLVTLVAFSHAPIGNIDYNADTRTLTVQRNILNPWWTLTSGDITSVGSYVGQNAYGATRKVEESEAIDYVLRTQIADISAVTLTVDSEKARALSNGGLRLLFIGHFESPYVKEKPISSSPTLNNPKALTINQRMIMFKTDEIWFYDIASGEIFLKRKDKMAAASGVNETKSPQLSWLRTQDRWLP